MVYSLPKQKFVNDLELDDMFFLRFKEYDSAVVRGTQQARRLAVWGGSVPNLFRHLGLGNDVRAWRRTHDQEVACSGAKFRNYFSYQFNFCNVIRSVIVASHQSCYILQNQYK